MSTITEMPVGYRFMPTDEELIKHYLINKVLHKPLPAPQPIQDIEAQEFYSKHPKTLVEDSDNFEWFFFIHEHQDTFCKLNSIRAVEDETGFWKSMENEDPVYNSEGDVFAFKFHLTYFSGYLRNARKTHWKMEEYRLPTKHGEKWVLARLKRGTYYTSYF